MPVAISDSWHTSKSHAYFGIDCADVAYFTLMDAKLSQWVVYFWFQFLLLSLLSKDLSVWILAQNSPAFTNLLYLVSAI